MSENALPASAFAAHMSYQMELQTEEQASAHVATKQSKALCGAMIVDLPQLTGKFLSAGAAAAAAAQHVSLMRIAGTEKNF